jgi:SAM-dependent methyltransferase
MALPRLIKTFGRPQPENLKLTLTTWFDSKLGQLLLQKQKKILGKVLPKYFGYHLIYSGLNSLDELIEESPIKHKVFLDCAKKQSSQISTDIHHLPFQSDSADLIVLQHNLDFEDDPFQVLREATRVVLPNGNIIIIGFNPWSLWGLWRAVLFRSSKSPWSSRFISPYRLSEWLDILGFDVQGCESAFYMPPVARLGEKESLNWIDHLGSAWLAQRGGFYLLVAKKRVSCITPVRLRNKSRRAKAIIPVAASGKLQNKRSENTIPFERKPS